MVGGIRCKFWLPKPITPYAGLDLVGERGDMLVSKDGMSGELGYTFLASCSNFAGVANFITAA